MENTEIQNDIIETPEINVEALEAGKLDFFSLPREQREALKQEVKAKLPERAQIAMENGWTPKEMFRGKYKDGTDKPWEDHETFLNRIEKEAPVRNERIRELSKDKESYKEQIDAMQKQIKALTEINKAKIERELLIDEKSINKELAEAEEFGDVSKYKEASEKKNLIEREKLKLKSFEEPPIPPTQPQLTKEVSDWAAKNSWIVNDQTLLRYAKIKDEEFSIDPETAHLPLAERLEMVAEEVAKKFPAHNPMPRRTVESGKNNAAFGSKPKQASFGDLSLEDKRQAHYLIKKGVYKSEADYMKFMSNLK